MAVYTSGMTSFSSSAEDRDTSHHNCPGCKAIIDEFDHGKGWFKWYCGTEKRSDSSDFSYSSKCKQNRHNTFVSMMKNKGHLPIGFNPTPAEEVRYRSNDVIKKKTQEEINIENMPQHVINTIERAKQTYPKGIHDPACPYMLVEGILHHRKDQLPATQKQVSNIDTKKPKQKPRIKTYRNEAPSKDGKVKGAGYKREEGVKPKKSWTRWVVGSICGGLVWWAFKETIIYAIFAYNI